MGMIRPIRIILALALVVLLLGGLLLYWRNPEPPFRESESVDEASRWRFNVIASDVRQGVGQSIAVGDLNGDGRPDVLAAHGARSKLDPRDGIYWYECPEDSRTAWKEHRLTDPKHPIAWSLGLGCGDVDGDDFLGWQANFGSNTGGGAATVPEPASALLLIFALGVMCPSCRLIP